MDSTITTAIAAIMAAERPAGLPENVAIVTEDGLSTLRRPYLLLHVEPAGGASHPRMFRGTLHFRLHTRADDTPPAAAAGYLRAVTAWFTENSSSVLDTLPLYGLSLMLFTPGEPSAAPDEDARTWLHEQPWNIAVRRI